MNDRMTKERLEERCANLNRRMESRRSVIRYAIQGRNGSTALDRTTAEGLARHTSIDLVRVGTKAEIGEFLHAMMTALDDAARKQL